jgi:hypothetical protein
MVSVRSHQTVRTIPFGIESRRVGYAHHPSAWRFGPIVAVAVSLLTLVSTASAKYSGGTGEPNDPYQIATAADLIALGETPDDYNKHFILTADIDLDPNLPGRKVFDRAVIAPTWKTPFTGVFDGDGHTISHLTIKGKSYVGLFGQLDRHPSVGYGGEVRNLGVVGVNVSGSEGYVGGLVGELNWGTVTQCYSTGAVSGNWDVGGLVGDNGGTVTDCYTTGTISGTGSQVGGLVGDNGSDGIVTHCYSTCTVKGTAGVGGLVGRNGSDWATVKECYSTGKVSGDSEVGGLVGSNSISIYNGRRMYGKVVASFWDVQTSGQSASGGGTGKTTPEMHDPNTFMAAGWDFVAQPDGPHDLWAEPAAGGYPVLYWQLPEEFGLPRFSGGTGEPNDPYRISTAKDLDSIGYNPRLTKCHFRLTADLDLTGLHFYPIGVYYYPYGGVFDGNGHTISHLTINGESYLGLFACLGSGAEIKNLGVVDVNVVGSGGCVGGLVGENAGGTVTDCYSTGTVSGTGWYVGGLVGRNWGIVTHCYSTAAASGDQNVGGLVGDNGGPVIDCYSTGTVSGTGSQVGGLVGENYGSVTHCHSTGAVSGAGRSVGGLVGYNWPDSSLTQCYSAGTVSASGEDIGGLVGYNGGNITTSYSTSAVSGTSWVGGLAGRNGVFNFGMGYSEFGRVTRCYSTGTVSGESYVGGLVGGIECGTVTQCYSAGAVSGTEFVGGLVGGLGLPWMMGPDLLAGCFWDTQTSGRTTSAGGTGKTTAEMQMASTFLEAGWDFVGETANGTEDIWWINEGKDYPRLWWELAEKKSAVTAGE